MASPINNHKIWVETTNKEEKKRNQNKKRIRKNKRVEHKKALDTLVNLQKKPSLSPEEKEAVATAIGILSWTSLAKNRLKARKEKRDQDTKW